MEKLNKVRAKWYDVGMQLRVSIDTLDAIKEQYLNHPSDCLRETLKMWLKTCPSPKWINIVDALRSSVVGEVRLAAELETEHCSTATHYFVPPAPLIHLGSPAPIPVVSTSVSTQPQLSSLVDSAMTSQYPTLTLPSLSSNFNHPRPPPDNPPTTQSATVTKSHHPVEHTGTFLLSSTVEPLYNGHHWEPTICPF